ncbi:MAG: hypothetical protein KBS96_02545 [Lachnospiraceae bacterium]|nr:hypothetical protein [Candidatus Colinaster scatohippi]
MNKKQFFQGIIFLCIVFILLSCSTYIVRTNGEVKDRFAGYYAEDKNSIDVIYVGASPVGASFSPGLLWHETGITSYPLSSNSQPTKSIKHLVKEAYGRQKPQLFVIEVRMFAEDLKEQEEDLAHIREVTDNMRQSPNRIRTINALVNDKKERYTYYFDIIKFHSNWQMFADANELKKFNYAVKNTDKGAVFSNEYMELSKGLPEIDPDMYDYMEAISTEQEEVLRDLLSYLKQNNIPALFVATPQFIRAHYFGNMHYIGSVVNEYGYDFYDMYSRPEDYGFDFDRDLKDGSHTNTYGSYKCTLAIADYINSNYSIDTSLSNESESDWQEAYESFVRAWEDATNNAVYVDSY